MSGRAGVDERGSICCENCTRERVTDDVFWHEDDQAWYCVDIYGCEMRTKILSERRDPAILARDENKAGVSLRWL